MSAQSEKERREITARVKVAYYDLLTRKTRLTFEDIEKLFAEGWTFREQYNLPDCWEGPDLRSLNVTEMVNRVKKQKEEATMAQPENIDINVKVIKKGWPEMANNLGADEIEHRFGFHKATIEGENATLPKHSDLRLEFRSFAEYLDEALPAGRAKSVALTELENASMWAHKSIAETAPVINEKEDNS